VWAHVRVACPLGEMPQNVRRPVYLHRAPGAGGGDLRPPRIECIGVLHTSAERRRRDREPAASQ